ncbi:MAG: hypothetical protein M1827_000092 [Pycnora praestabilis]|nr:MAG: hypothetical protein M1827_000092 [Pycnora praestabilis]
MSTLSGVLSPPPSLEDTTTVAPSGKRKRGNSRDTEQINGVVDRNQSAVVTRNKIWLKTLLSDIFEILKRQDSLPSILEHPLPSTKDDSPSTEPSSKRLKMLGLGDDTSIGSRLLSGSYSSLDELMVDIDMVSSQILTTVQPKDSHTSLMTQVRPSPLSLENEKSIASVLAFKKALNSILLREKIQRPNAFEAVHELEVKANEGKRLTIAVEDSQSNTLVNDGQENKTVLTLYGNAPQAKQLFSSLQTPVRLPNVDDPTLRGSSLKYTPTLPVTTSSIQVLPTLREAGLPNGITTTKIIPMHSIDSLGDKKRVSTLGDLFAPPATLPHLNPPKLSRHTSTKCSTIDWYNPAAFDASLRTSRRGSYNTQPLSTGQWLNYNTLPLSPQSSSPEAKRKQRDRALSTGEARPPLSQEAIVAHKQAREESLFHSAYSSFAPSRDDAAAIIPEGTKNRLWWHRLGESRFVQSFAMEPALETPPNTADFDPSTTTEDIDELDTFRRAVEAWNPEAPPTEFLNGEEKDSQQSVMNKDMTEVLQDVSDLLETLNSYQRIRNLSLAANTRSTVGPNVQLTATMGSPSAPSAAEFDTYSILKSQLTLLISSLPPYAVAKLNGQQLEELNISTRLPIESMDYRGTMEEDEMSTRIKATTLAGAAGTSARTSAPTMSTHLSHAQYPAAQSANGQHPPRPNYMSQVSSSRSSQHVPGQYYAQQQTPARPLSTGSHRPSISNAHNNYHVSRGAASASQHPTYPQNAYGQQTPRPSQSQMGVQSNPQQYLQHNQHGYAYNPPYHNQHQTGPQTPGYNRSYQQPSQPKYQQRAQNQHRDVSYNSSQSPYPAARSASPQKVSSYTPQSQQQQRPSYPTPSQGQPRQYPQQPAQGAQQSPQPTYQNPSSLGASGFHTFMSPEQQALMMERQRAQIQSQQQARVAAQVSMSMQDSGTPQPQSNQHGYNGQINGVIQSNTNGGAAVTAGSGQ